MALSGQARNDGFIRFGIQWSSVMSESMCADQRAPGNALRVEPSSRFTYSYDRSAIKSIATAWSALPPNPVLLVSGKNLSAEAYDLSLIHI